MEKVKHNVNDTKGIRRQFWIFSRYICRFKKLRFAAFNVLLLRVGGNGWREVSFISRICKNSDGTTRGYACSCVPRISFVRGRSSISPLRFVYRRPSPPVSEYPRSDRVAQSIDRSGFAPSTLSPRNRGVLKTHDGRRRRRRKSKTLLENRRSFLYIEVRRNIR